MFRVNETKCMFSSKEILRILDCKACEVKDFEITEVSVDSRSVNKPESTLFFALKGINHDGHDYVEKLYEQGVRNFVVTELRADFLPLSGANFFVVDEVLPALQQLAAWYRGQMKAEVVGITGSNGKRSSKNGYISYYRMNRVFIAVPVVIIHRSESLCLCWVWMFLPVWPSLKPESLCRERWVSCRQ